MHVTNNDIQPKRIISGLNGCNAFFPILRFDDILGGFRLRPIHCFAKILLVVNN